MRIIAIFAGEKLGVDRCHTTSAGAWENPVVSMTKYPHLFGGAATLSITGTTFQPVG